MNVTNALCPQCKKVVTFVRQGNFNRCPECGTMYQLAEWRHPLDYQEPRRSELGEFFGQLLKAVLIMVAVGVVVLGVAFAGCAVLLIHH